MFHESIVFFGVPSHVWSYNISVNDRINVRNIFKIYTSQEYCHPPLCNMDVSSRFTHHMTTGTNSVPSCPLEEITCHTHGGLHTYHSPSVNVSPYYSIHKMCYYIHIHHIITDALWDVLMSDWVNLSSVCLITHITILWKSPSV